MATVRWPTCCPRLLKINLGYQQANSFLHLAELMEDLVTRERKLWKHHCCLSLRNSGTCQIIQVIVSPSLIIHSWTLSYCNINKYCHTLNEAWKGQEEHFRHSQRKTERQPILFTALQTTNHADIVEKDHITMHNEAFSRTDIINCAVDVKHRPSSNWPLGVQPTTVTDCATHS